MVESPVKTYSQVTIKKNERPSKLSTAIKQHLKNTTHAINSIPNNNESIQIKPLIEFHMVQFKTISSTHVLEKILSHSSVPISNLVNVTEMFVVLFSNKKIRFYQRK